MILYKCAKCGAGELEPLGDGKKAMCVYCNSVMVLPTLDPEAFNHANALRKEMKFDQAEMAFQRIVSEYPQDSESYWNLVLCRYGIEYVEEKDEDDPDGAVRNYVPTCHRMSYDSILNDSDYQKALQYADGYSKRIYEEEAQKIDRILKRAVYIAQTQPEYDIFISYKESDNAIGGSKERTEDSFIAQEIYDELKKKHPNLNIFLSRVTLSQVAAGLEYEPIIFSALNSAKMMILVGTSKENLESTWVKNEWSRYRKMMGNGKKRAIAVVYRGMDPKTDFPDELRMHAIQGTEAKGFYLQDFIPGVEEYLGIKANAMGFEAEQIYQAGNVRQAANLCIRAEQAIMREKYEEAEAYLEKALDADPESSRAWWGMVALESHNFTKVCREREFEQYKDVLSNWQMVQQYAKEPELSAYTAQMEKYKAICDEAHEDYWAENKRLSVDLCVKAENCIKYGRYKDAEEVLKEAIGKDSKNPRAWWDMIVVKTNNFTSVYAGDVLGLPKEIMDSWQMVQQYAKDPELAAYTAQIEKYEALCIKNDKRARTTELFRLIKDKTKVGTYFGEYARYGLDSAYVKELMALIVEPEDARQAEEIKLFLRKYENNYAKYLELLEFKKTDPIAKLKASSEYLKYKKALETAETALGKNDRVKSFSIWNVLISIVIVAFCYFANSGSEIARSILKVTIYIVPLLASLMVSSMIVSFFPHEKTGIEDELSLKYYLPILIPTIVFYMAIQCWLYLEAKALEPELAWLYISGGVLFLLMGTIIAGGIIWCFVLHGSGLLWFVGIGIFVWCFLVAVIKGLGEEALVWSYQKIFEVMLIVVIAIAAICLIRYIRNKSEIKKCSKLRVEYEMKEAEFARFQEAAISEMKEPYKGFVAPEYLTGFDI